MLGLALRKEFRGEKIEGTAVDLAESARLPAAEHLAITYPSADVLAAIEAIGPAQGRPVVLIGDRGQGKSHLLAAIHHTLRDPAAARAWLGSWSASARALPLRGPVHVITEDLQKQSYRFLWDLVLDRHPHGAAVRASWEGMGQRKTEVPGADLLMELFEHTPTALVLDELQTWFDGLVDDERAKPAAWAFNFLQILSEIAAAHPERLLLVVSVRDGHSAAFAQLRRVNPRLVDFAGSRAKGERIRLLLHRLFENRRAISESRIAEAIAVHAREMLRLCDIPPAEHAEVRRELVETWPFSPRLVALLEEVLAATPAQETRDLLRILAGLFKRRGESSPVLTAADFRIDDEDSGIVERRLRDRAHDNLGAIAAAVPAADVPHLAELMGALWIRSLASGAGPRDLQLDITRSERVDDNAFQLQLRAVVDHSFNIHREGERLFVREAENPHAKLLAHARNDRLFAGGADQAFLAKLVQQVLNAGPDFHIVVDDSDRPERWDDRIPIVVLPEPPDRLAATLGTWLRERLSRRRNTVRFLIPRAGTPNLYTDRSLLVPARAALLAAEWKRSDGAYAALHTRHLHEARGALEKRFDRFAILATWNFQAPELCTFHVEAIRAEGARIPEAIDTAIREHLFVPEDFDDFVRAAEGRSTEKMLAELREPRPSGAECIPWLGEARMRERLDRSRARDDRPAPAPAANDGHAPAPFSAETPTSALNLLARVSDDWQIAPGTKLRSVKLCAGSLTGAQLHALLKALPPGEYTLDLEREDE